MNFKEEILKIDYFKDFSPQLLFDPLTKTVRREFIIKYTKNLVKNNKPFIMAFFDMDNLKGINDGLGHFVGDNVLKMVSDKLLNAVGLQGVVGRYGGDEFLVIIEGSYSYDEKYQLIKDIHDKITLEYHTNAVFGSIAISATMGVVEFPENASTYEDLMEKSDKALYRGKQKGRNCFVIYNDLMHKDIDVSNVNSIDSIAVRMQRITDTLTSPNISFKLGIHNVFERLTKFMGIYSIYYVPNEGEIISNDLYHEDIPRLLLNEIDPNNLITAHVTVNDYETFKETYENAYKYCQESRYNSLCIVPVACGGHIYGRIVAVDNLKKRLWKTEELTLLTHTACTIAIKLNSKKD